MKRVIYTDGSCLGNPGPGGWACALFCDDEPACEVFGSAALTTNNQMELQAAIEALSLVPEGGEVDIWTDSQYLQKGLTAWVSQWKRNGWLTAQKKPVKNLELWQMLDGLSTVRYAQFFWVKAHNRNPGNERVDTLARAAAVSQCARTVQAIKGLSQ